MFQSTLPTRGSDTYAHIFMLYLKHVSIHAPHEGERPGVRLANLNPGMFQSTLPTRGSDKYSTKQDSVIMGVSIHAPHEGERRMELRAGGKMKHVSIHAPHEGERR